MDLQTKHLSGKNAKGFLGTLLITGVVLLSAALSLMQGVSVPKISTIIVFTVVIIANVIAFQMLKMKKAYMYFSCASIAVVSCVTLLLFEEPGVYALLYPVAILMVMYNVQALSIIAAVLAVVLTVIHGIVMLMAGRVTASEVCVEVIMVIVAYILSIVVAFLQMRQSKESMEAVRSGAESQAQTSDLIVQLAENLNEKFVKAQQVSDNLNETMTTSHVSVSEIAESTKLNAEAIEQQTNQTSDIQQSIQNVGDEAKQMGEISGRANETVQDGVELINRLKAQAGEVAKINMETRATTEALNESIRDVQAITETILGISSQTNLLALNASIEAARAGEAGKGFAVVADEIRTLSEGTREATQQISEIIERLTEDAQSAAESMTQSADFAQKQNELIEETGKKLFDIKAETDELYRGVCQVNHSVDFIITANAAIMDSITNLSATGEQVAASTDTALSISDSSMTALKEMNGLLSEIREIAAHMEEAAQK